MTGKPTTHKERKLGKLNKIDHPPHYGGDTPYEAIKVIEAWNLNFSLGSVLKYVRRAGSKPGESDVEDLQKAAWYLRQEIERRLEAALRKRTQYPMESTLPLP